MHTKRIHDIHQINYLTSEMNALYHQASLKLGISDSISVVLYTIYDQGNHCLLSDVYKKSGISKQTVNSAIRSLEKQELLYLEKMDGRSKRIVLTDKGKDYVNQTVAKLFQAEVTALSLWSEQDIQTYISLLEKYITSLREQVTHL